jgi:hypothetical protein
MLDLFDTHGHLAQADFPRQPPDFQIDALIRIPHDLLSSATNRILKSGHENSARAV